MAARQEAKVRDGGLGSGRLGLKHRHARPFTRIAADCTFDLAGRRRLSCDQRQIVAADCAGLQLADQIGLRFERFGDHHQSRGVLVKAMHDTGTGHRRQLRQTMDQPV